MHEAEQVVSQELSQEAEPGRLKSAIYGVPDAGQNFAMKLQAVLVNDLHITQSEVDPSCYFKFEYVDDDRSKQGSSDQRSDQTRTVKDWLIIITWTDDFRYIGSDGYLDWFENEMCGRLKCKLLGNVREFVSLETNCNVEEGTTTLTRIRTSDLKANWSCNKKPLSERKRCRRSASGLQSPIGPLR